MIRSGTRTTNLAMWIRTKALVAAAVFEQILAGLVIFLICSSAAVAEARRDPNAPQRGNDLQYTMTIEFKEAIFGKESGYYNSAYGNLR